MFLYRFEHFKNQLKNLLKTETSSFSEVITEDNMPGLPIEPEVISQTEALSETSPSVLDTLVDTEPALSYTESTSDDGGYKITEAEIEKLAEELHEIEPPDEDQIDDFESPAVEITGPDTDLDDGDSDEDDENQENSDRAQDEADGENKNDLSGQNSNTCANSEDVMDRLKADNVDGNGESDATSEGQRNSGEVFHDAVDSNDIGKEHEKLTGDPGGTESENKDCNDDNRDNDDLKTKLSDSNEGTSVDTDTTNKDIENGFKSNNNLDKDKIDKDNTISETMSEEKSDNVTEAPTEQV